MKYLMIMMILVLSGCGYSSMKNEMSAQIKKVVFNTPVLCNDYVTAHVLLGIMRGGVGSMSNEDLDVTVETKADINLLQDAVELGKIVKIEYKVKRWVWCVQDHIVTSASLVEESKK